MEDLNIAQLQHDRALREGKFLLAVDCGLEIAEIRREIEEAAR